MKTKSDTNRNGKMLAVFFALIALGTAASAQPKEDVSRNVNAVYAFRRLENLMARTNKEVQAAYVRLNWLITKTEQNMRYIPPQVDQNNAHVPVENEIFMSDLANPNPIAFGSFIVKKRAEK